MLLTVDTLNIAFRSEDFNPFDLLGISVSEFEEGSKPEFNYSFAYYLQGIKVSGGGCKGFSWYINLSGKGCRILEDYHSKDFDWLDFISNILILGGDIRRIDIACDEYTGILKVRRCCFYFEQHKVAGACRTFKYTLGSEEIFYAGSPQSNCLIRIYNKALERGYKDGLKDGHPWNRCEIQLRDDAAKQLCKEWLFADDLAPVYSGHVLNQLRFLVDKNPGPHSDRVPTAKWWVKFLGDVSKIKFCSSPGSEYNFYKCSNYLHHQAASSIKAYILATGQTPQQIYDEFTSFGIVLNDDQKYMVEKMRGV